MMPRQSELVGVAHNIAHHASSGLSFISPHLAKALRLAGSEATSIELFSPTPYPSNAVESQPLRLALGTLAEFVATLLSKHGYSKQEIVSVVLHAMPLTSDEAGYTLSTRVEIKSVSGTVYESKWLYA